MRAIAMSSRHELLRSYVVVVGTEMYRFTKFGTSSTTLRQSGASHKNGPNCMFSLNAPTSTAAAGQHDMRRVVQTQEYPITLSHQG